MLCSVLLCITKVAKTLPSTPSDCRLAKAVADLGTWCWYRNSGKYLPACCPSSPARATSCTQKINMFRAPPSSPTQVPCNIMQNSCSHYIVDHCGKRACFCAHGSRTSQQSCRHSQAICAHRFIELCSHEHTQSTLKPPLHGGDRKHQSDSSRACR